MSASRATSFGAATSAYEQGRPSYPGSAIDWLLAGATREVTDVVDVGAGTGKLTAGLVRPGRNLTAVDPDESMLATLASAVAKVNIAVGTAEHLPLPAASADAVLLGQAWHWVDPVAASAEIGRVLRPGGVLGVIWNLRDERAEWVRRLTTIIHTSTAEELVSGHGVQILAPFEHVEQSRWEWSRPMTRATLRAMVASRSYYITATDDVRHGIDAGLVELMDELGMTTDDATVDLPYVTVAYRAIR